MDVKEAIEEVIQKRFQEMQEVVNKLKAKSGGSCASACPGSRSASPANASRTFRESPQGRAPRAADPNNSITFKGSITRLEFSSDDASQPSDPSRTFRYVFLSMNDFFSTLLM